MRTRTLLWVAAVLCALTAIPIVRSANELARPPGVAAADWMVITDHLGFVIEHQRAGARENSLEGHFMVRRDGDWWRLDAYTRPSVLPTLVVPQVPQRMMPCGPSSSPPPGPCHYY
jgi:hypothetical protein